jgi:hypothetical protein
VANFVLDSLSQAQATNVLSSVGPGGMTVLFRPNVQQQHRILDRIGKQEKENLGLMEQNKALSDIVAGELNKSSSRPSKSTLSTE